MAMNTRHYRPLVAAGRRFRWQCRFNYIVEYGSVAAAQGRLPPDRLLVRSEDRPQCLLRVTWNQFPCWLVTPRLVRLCIEDALRRGWLSELATLTLNDSDIPALTQTTS
jgi:hypothetical protein